MESGLESTDESGVRQEIAQYVHSVQVSPVMHRSQGDPVLHALQYFIGQFKNAVVVFAQRHLEAHALDLAHV